MEIDDSLYLEATNDFESDKRDQALWAKSLSLCEGDEKKAKYKYINERVKTIKRGNNKLLIEEAELNRKGNSFLFNLTEGNYSLAQTYWLYGVIIGGTASFPINLITSKAWLAFYLIGLSIYEMAALVGIWNSSNKYKGQKTWSQLAKFAAILGWLLLALTWAILIQGII